MWNKGAMGDKLKATTAQKLDKVAAPVKGTIDKGKAMQAKVDSKVEYSTVEFIACWASVTLYEAFVAPLNSVCMLITSIAAQREKKKLILVNSIVNGAILLAFLGLCIGRRYVVGISYPLAALLTWFLITLQSQKTANSEVDDCIIECMSLCGTTAPAPADLGNITSSDFTSSDEQLNIVLDDNTIL